MCRPNHNHTTELHLQSIPNPRQRSTRTNTDAVQYEAIRKLAAEDNATTVQNAHHTIDGEAVNQRHHPDSTALPTQQRLEFYKYRWFRMLILLIYCLSLAVAGEILAAFPAAGAIRRLKDAGPYLIPLYAEWLAINSGVIWASSIIGVICTVEDVPMPRPKWMIRVGAVFESWRDRVRGFMPPALVAWVETVAWTLLILGATASSTWLSVFLIWPNRVRQELY